VRDVPFGLEGLPQRGALVGNLPEQPPEREDFEMAEDVFHADELAELIRNLTDPTRIEGSLAPVPLEPSEPLPTMSPRWRRIWEAIEADRRQPIPFDEPGISGGPLWRRIPRRWLFAATRPLRRRYDRLVADLAALGLELAEHAERTAAELVDVQREVARLRSELDLAVDTIHRMKMER